jgi:predicted HTH domain antitoxin
MELRLPDQLVRGLEMTEDEWLLDLALGLYVDRRVTLGRAAEIARISKPAFMDALGSRRIPINYDRADLESDLGTIADLRGRARPSKA